MIETHHRVCNLCEAMCGVAIKTKTTDTVMPKSQNREIVSIRGHPDDVFSKGAFCPKSQGLLDLYQDPDRLKNPLKKVGNDFIEIPWNQAFDEITSKVQEIQARHGRSSVASYLGNPNSHNFGAMMFLPLFLKSLGSSQRFSATSVDQLPHHLVAYLMFGHQLLLPIADVDHTDFMIILGANPAVSNGSLLSAPGLSSRLKKIVSRGGSVVVLDPRYTETASVASEHLFIRPGSDVFFLAGLLRTLVDGGMVRTRHLAELIEGESLVRDFVSQVDLKQVVVKTGITLDIIERLARDFFKAERALIYGRLGVSTQEFGTLSQWLIHVINILTGNFDREGGVLFTKPAFDPLTLFNKKGRNRGSFARRLTRLRKLPETHGEFPVVTLADEILTPGKGQIKALFTIAGNPVLSTPNGSKLERALPQLDLMVAVDFYLNETTRHAHYILPGTSPMERSHFDVIFNLFSIRNTVRYSPALMAKPEGTRHDWEILVELGRRLTKPRSSLKKLTHALTTQLILATGPEAILDLGLRFGAYGLGRGALSLKKLKDHPTGIDLGPLQSSVAKAKNPRIFHKNGKINLAPKEILKDFDRFFTQLTTDDSLGPSEFMLIGRRILRSNNSWMHNCPSLKQAQTQCFALMNPRDAEGHGIQDGDRICVKSPIGKLELKVALSERIMEKVISIPHGFGHHRPGIRQHLAQEKPGVSVNDITDDQRVDPLTGNAAFSGQVVEVSTLRPI